MKHKLYSVILGLFLCGVTSYTSTLRKPPNMRYKKHKIGHYSKTRNNPSSCIVTHVTLTCYQPVRSQCDKDPLTTSDGSRINLRHLKNGRVKWCAISRDLLYLFQPNKCHQIWIDGYGLYYVKDVMNKRFRHSVDILQHPANAQMIKKTNVKIKIFK